MSAATEQLHTEMQCRSLGHCCVCWVEGRGGIAFKGQLVAIDATREQENPDNLVWICDKHARQFAGGRLSATELERCRAMLYRDLSAGVSRTPTDQQRIAFFVAAQHATPDA